jgi:hypothetical protein
MGGHQTTVRTLGGKGLRYSNRTQRVVCNSLLGRQQCSFAIDLVLCKSLNCISYWFRVLEFLLLFQVWVFAVSFLCIHDIHIFFCYYVLFRYEMEGSLDVCRFSLLTDFFLWFVCLFA